MKKAFSTTTLFVGSDCTGPYDVTLYGEPTVKDFLNQLLEERKEKILLYFVQSWECR